MFLLLVFLYVHIPPADECYVLLFWFCRFNHKTAAEDVHFTSVLSDSDSDSEEPEPDTSGSDDETPKEATKRRGKFNSSPKPKEAAETKGKLNNGVDDSPKPKEATKRRGKSNPNVDESPKEAIKQRSKSAPAAAESPKPKEATYKRRSKPNPIEEEDEPIKDRGVSDPGAEEENGVGSPSDWEGSSEVLEMIMVKDVAKGTEVGYLHSELWHLISAVHFSWHVITTLLLHTV